MSSAVHMGPVTPRDVAALLASTLGEEKSAEVVDAAIASLGMGEGPLDQARVDEILEHLSRAQGIVGLAARFARQRARFSAVTIPPPPTAQDAVSDANDDPSPRGRAVTSGGDVAPDAPLGPRSVPLPPEAAAAPPRNDSPGRPGLRMTCRALVELFVPTLGEEKSDDVVRAAIRHLGLVEDSVDREQALAVLESLAVVPGIVGVTARFARARLVLRFA